MTPINSKTAAAVRMECLRCMDGQEQDHSVLGHFPISTPLRCHWKWTIKQRVRMGSIFRQRRACSNVDPTRFIQVLSNLLQNATKVTEPGGSIRVSAHVGGSNRGRRRELSLSVIDRGIGILQS